MNTVQAVVTVRNRVRAQLGGVRRFRETGARAHRRGGDGAEITGTTALMSELLNDSTIVPVVNSSGDPEFECPRGGGMVMRGQGDEEIADHGLVCLQVLADAERDKIAPSWLLIAREVRDKLDDGGRRMQAPFVGDMLREMEEEEYLESCEFEQGWGRGAPTKGYRLTPKGREALKSGHLDS